MFRMVIYLPESLLLGTACATPVILPRLGATSKRCVESGNARVEAIYIRARISPSLWLTQAKVPVLPAEGREERNIFVHCDFFTVL